MLKTFILILILCVSKMGVAQTRAGTSALPFLEINNNAKSMGLAGADVALMGGNGAHLNPAILGGKNVIIISSPFNFDADYPIFSTPWLPTLTDDITFSSPIVAVGRDTWSFAFHVNRLSYGKSEVFLEDENQKTYNSYDVIRGLSFSYKVNEKLSVGIGANAYKSKIFNTSFSGFTFDFGTYFEHPIIYQDLKVTPSLGWSLTDFGQAIKIKNETYFIDTDSDDEIQTTIITNSYPINMMMRGGAGLKLESDTKVFGFTPISLAWYGALSKSMVRYKEDGTAYNAFQALVKSWTPMCTERYNMSFGSSECSEEVSVWDQFMRHSGFEFVILETVSLRFGHYYEDEYNGDREYDTFGIGVQYSFFAFDYGEYKAPSTDYLRNGRRIKYYQLSLNIPLSLGSKLIKKQKKKSPIQKLHRAFSSSKVSIRYQNEGITSTRYMVSSRVTLTIKVMNTTAPKRSKVLNLLSHFSPIKQAATKYALQSAIVKAERISSGLGRPRFETSTVTAVSITKPVPTLQSVLADVM